MRWGHKADYYNLKAVQSESKLCPTEVCHMLMAQMMTTWVHKWPLDFMETQTASASECKMLLQSLTGTKLGGGQQHTEETGLPQNVLKIGVLNQGPINKDVWLCYEMIAIANK